MRNTPQPSPQESAKGSAKPAERPDAAQSEAKEAADVAGLEKGPDPDASGAGEEVNPTLSTLNPQP